MNNAKGTASPLGFVAITILATMSVTGMARAQERSAGAAIPQEARSRIERTLEAYEAVRGRLANDEFTAVTSTARPLERLAKDPTPRVPENLRGHLREIEVTARRLRRMSKGDASAVRRAFGDVSRPIVALVMAQPSLRRGWHLFECSMAEGYKKWLQKAEQISNPYMGRRMPRCGSQRAWQ